MLPVRDGSMTITGHIVKIMMHMKLHIIMRRPRWKLQEPEFHIVQIAIKIRVELKYLLRISAMVGHPATLFVGICETMLTYFGKNADVSVGLSLK